MMRGKQEDAPEAIRRLIEAGVPVRKRAFGFSLEHPEWRETNRSFAECGCEHDGSISLSVGVDEWPPSVRFHRFDFLEMSDFVMVAYRKVSPDSKSVDIVAEMRSEDSNYDHGALDIRLEQWQRDFDDYFRRLAR